MKTILGFLKEKIKAGWKNHIGEIVLLILLVLCFNNWAQQRLDMELLLQERESIYSEVVIVKNNNRSLSKTIKDSKAENLDLLSLLVELKAKPTEIEYVIRTETQLIPTDPIIIYTELPASHTHTINNIPVARFTSSANDYTFETATLSFRTDLVVTKRSTAGILRVKSSMDPQIWHEVPMTLKVTTIKEKKFFAPELGIGITASLPEPDISASVYLPLFHPTKNIDLVAPRVSLNSSGGHLGLDPVSYNIGSQIPLVNDLWLSPGASINEHGLWSVDLTIGSKL